MRIQIIAAVLITFSAPALAKPGNTQGDKGRAEVSDMCWDAANPHWFRCSDDPAMKAFVKKHSHPKRTKRRHP